MNQSGYLETSLLTNPIMREMPTHTSRMTLADDVNLEEFFMTKEEFSGADIKAKCTDVGLLALREGHMKVTIYFVLCGATKCFFGSLLWSSKWLRFWGKLTPWWVLFSNLIRFQLNRRHKL